MPDELSKAGTLVTNDAAIALVRIPLVEVNQVPAKSWVLALDRTNDPGNLGAIIRIADWYGIHTVLVSHGSVDVYNPKVVSASKGSLARIRVAMVNLPALLAAFKGPVYGAAMQGRNIHQVTNPEPGVILMGSESHGIGALLQPLVTQFITIKRVGQAESLNVAVAAGIVCDNLIHN